MPKKTTRSVKEAAALHSLLANSVRLLILLELAGGQQSVTALAGAVGHSRQGVSQHLQDLARAEVVTFQQDGTTRHYALVLPLNPIISATLATLRPPPAVRFSGADAEGATVDGSGWIEPKAGGSDA